MGMRRRFTPIAAAIASLACAACQPAGNAGDPSEGDSVVILDEEGGSDEQHALPVGEYRLAGADGADVNLGHAITVSVSAERIETFSQCVTPRWNYRYEDGQLRTEPIIEPICDRGRYPAEDALAAVFDDPQEVRRTPENGFYLTGGGHSITLFTQ